MPQAQALIEFWQQAGRARWFARDDAFDDDFNARFSAAHFSAARCEYEAWIHQPEPALALLLLLDQFPRNCFRDSAHAYATDGLARRYAAQAIDAGWDQQVDATLRIFFYLPFEHSEALADQQRSLDLFRAQGDAEFIKYAQLHYDIIARFGRFPHRNAALGRISTPQELDYLAGGGFKG